MDNNRILKLARLHRVITCGLLADNELVDVERWRARRDELGRQKLMAGEISGLLLAEMIQQYLAEEICEAQWWKNLCEEYETALLAIVRMGGEAGRVADAALEGKND